MAKRLDSLTPNVDRGVSVFVFYVDRIMACLVIAVEGLHFSPNSESACKSLFDAAAKKMRLSASAVF